MSETTLIAGIDCGTNSIRLKIARATLSADGSLHVEDVVPRLLRVIRLGQGVDRTHHFAEAALERAYAAAREFAAVLAEHQVDALRFVATSATRDADNREAFEDTMEQLLGVRPEVISGEEEAALSFLGATSALPQADAPLALPAPYLVVDLGGGSTELVLGGDGETLSATAVQAAYSMNVGSVRMTERYLRSDPPTKEQIMQARRDVDEHIAEAMQRVPLGRVRTIIGVSGTVTTMTALALGLPTYDHRRVDGARLTFEQAHAVDERFMRMPRAERATYQTIHPGRVDVVGGGAVVWDQVLENVARAVRAEQGVQLDSYIASEHGLLDGIVRDMARRALQR